MKIVKSSLNPATPYVLVQAFEKAKKKMMRQEALAEEAPDATLVAQERLTGAIERLTHTIETRN